MPKADIWMPFFVGDYLADTMRLTTEQHGAYLLLILDYWKNGPPPDDNEVLAHIVRLPVETWIRHRRALSPFFDVSEGQWLHGRVDAERRKANAHKDKSSNGGRSKWGSYNGAQTGRELRSQRLAEARRKGRHTDAQWQALNAFCGRHCVACGATENIVKDHIVPIYQGGSDGIENLQPLCHRCNSSKGPSNQDLRPANWRECLRKCLPDACTPPSPSEEEELPNGSSRHLDDDDGLTVDEVVEAWNLTAERHGLPVVRKMTDERRKRVKARIREHSLEDFQQALRHLGESPFLLGQGRGGWKADFDFFTQKSSFLKLLEGSYAH